MALSPQQTQFVKDWFGEVLIHWSHPSGDDAYKYMDEETYLQEAIDYVNKITTSNEQMMSEWGDVFEDIKKDFQDTFEVKIDDATLHVMFILELKEHCEYV